MASSARNLQGLMRRALAGAEGISKAGAGRGFASESKAFTPDGRYTPGIYSRTKPVDRSYEWVAKNPYIEAWYYRRDHYEKEFAWTLRHTFEAVWFLGGFSLGFYLLSEFCFRHADRRSGYPRRTVLGDEPGMVLPDEREFY
ncbi:NADH:ubiquinone oxidoreductase 13 kDa subunit [Volvox carteri f. nagariensis]|uniref:NADH:ubiquinone oxidoreductase 13 kDa subunit n=1 Tax=Volvox carteri f. nagariensis TaxID=3068 RepID=D8TVP5_VOLCA|nr:NADH:ubiquinone oxidoreductase 13 kDa subunit [Volvox carteri f. nagariensis]EFJ48619.1 NADH:ubiquinone oxidoreductase 13 kDa subunit [Volvox carteri f. nagariensis]|eukprot:XP_002950418.1 NADH:ubiquinone oxidoreductase 13 kDa subunit [Volvox carteri f. nagariensis]